MPPLSDGRSPQERPCCLTRAAVGSTAAFTEEYTRLCLTSRNQRDSASARMTAS
jgi:hypothetical protein